VKIKEGLRRWRKAAQLILGALALLAALAVISAVGVSVTEERDAFCATCHLNPERTYVNRAARASQAFEQGQQQELTSDDLQQTGRDAARDLASAHRAAALNCVACHRGDNSLSDRAIALTLGGRNTLLYLTGQFDPDHSGVVNPDLVETSCLHCHVDQPLLGRADRPAQRSADGAGDGEVNPVTVDSFENHFHSYLFAPEYINQTAVGCLDCHPSHLEIPPIVPFFIDEEDIVLPACVQCHIDVQRGPIDL
jgi:hypothetical protein